jgi:hypothetical protein
MERNIKRYKSRVNSDTGEPLHKFQKFVTRFIGYDFRCACFDWDATLVDFNGQIYPETLDVLKRCRRLCNLKAESLSIRNRNVPYYIPMFMLSRNPYVEQNCAKYKIETYFDAFFITRQFTFESKVDCFRRNQIYVADESKKAIIEVANAVLFDDDCVNLYDWKKAGGLPLYVQDGDIRTAYNLFEFVVTSRM